MTGHDSLGTRLILLATGGSAALLAGAFGFQALGHAPCDLCLWQRWPHAAAVALGLIGLVLVSRTVPVALAALAMAGSVGLGIYHTGVERHWWPGPASCTSGAIGGLSPEDLMSRILAAPMVRCDEVSWSLLGLSMASWNAIASAVLAAIWLRALTRG
ncbi:disulfide bond formation protein B [Rhodobacter veldkampii DSM 11550]|uniref:Disulfide bond formation protein B n=1 Tax=Phaeovulum veldkampii DSM 11550 TaxID=1185920 RepID=A0A2T4JLZ1_9RHOB|nr:disulfide bond formation protein B [Phaeovulum veldkampii]MBK5945988.1 disulfide bond formation protein B [Phaeovulum veldkampii DSM 11550]PTE18892.1 disulfide bond formation protein B [Phaeovulum veldkampii DSM 11550]TDQ64616.1 disulfide bond formation protein DsbB [Phaeovulum veldkampii DSM 11550]